MQNTINPIIHEELKRLMGEVIQVSIAGLNFNPTGCLNAYDEKTGRVLLKRPHNHSKTDPVETMCVDAAMILAVGHRTGYQKQND